jgi:Spy/CpxP family protein refolding chaperone
MKRINNIGKYAAALAVAGAITLFAGAIQAQPGGGGQGGGPGGGRGGFGGGLDQAQMTTLREAMAKDQDAAQAIQDKLQAAQKELMKAVLADPQVEKTIQAKADEVAKLQAQLMVLRAKAFATVNPTLKPEQKDQMIENRFSFMLLQGGMGMRGQGGPGGQPGAPGGQGGRGQRGGGQGGGGQGGGTPKQ